MPKLLLSEITYGNVQRFISKPSHALLISGSLGSGKLELARYISREILELKSDDKLNNYPYFRVFRDDNNLISIDTVREIKRLFSLRTTGKALIRRIVVIDNVTSMSNEAQNAILKILEEPPEDSILILTSKNNASLNQTIISRVQTITIRRPTLDQTLEYFSDQSFKETDIKSAYLFSGGAIGLTQRILRDVDENNLLSYLNEAKTLLKANRFDKLLNVDEWAKDKDTLPLRLFSLKRVVDAILQLSIRKNQDNTSIRMLNALRHIQLSQDTLSNSVNAKLLLTNLFANL